VRYIAAMKGLLVKIYQQTFHGSYVSHSGYYSSDLVLWF